ncbi:hypothetical protein COF04_03790 [Bacillus toyonensis]|uniref:hypothetical protein n=1 Tax=Bacillus toyonensis TaxID=155322 RepID=UPI000BFD8073|nr:hypothetical protein [Bacillus toyonensis]PHC05708.1 hypothetical protein COF04_03790 [Bacillus toyonensis]
MEVNEITRLESGFEYLEIDCFSENQLLKYTERQRQFSAKITKNWDKDKKVEWLIRNYLSLKMILSSTLLLNSAEFAKESNLRVVEPYLLYYSLLNTGRALLFADPSVEWNTGALIRLSHNRVISRVFEGIRIISPKEGERIKFFLEEAKGQRELFSYRFPSNGVYSIKHQSSDIDFEETLNTCRLLTELAQFNSEIFQISCEKNINEMINLKDFDLSEGFIYKDYVKTSYDNDSDSVIDHEDYYRLSYFIRKKLDPVNIFWTAREGLVEDFFGAWTLAEEDRGDAYFDPDQNWGLLLSPL